MTDTASKSRALANMSASVAALKKEVGAKSALVQSLADHHFLPPDDDGATTGEGAPLSHYIRLIKAQLEIMNRLLAEKEARTQALRITARYTRVQEVSIEADAMIAQCERLQTAIAAGRARALASPAVLEQRKKFEAELAAHAKELQLSQSRQAFVRQSWSHLKGQLCGLMQSLETLAQADADADDSVEEEEERLKSDAELAAVKRETDAMLAAARRERLRKEAAAVEAEKRRSKLLRQLEQRRQELRTLEEEEDELREQLHRKQKQLAAEEARVRDGERRVAAERKERGQPQQAQPTASVSPKPTPAVGNPLSNATLSALPATAVAPRAGPGSHARYQRLMEKHGHRLAETGF